MSRKHQAPPPRMPDRLPDTTPQLPPSRPDSPAYLAFKAWWQNFRAHPPACEHRDVIGSFVRIGAVFAPHVRKPGDFEAEEERAAIQAEGNEEAWT